MQRRSAIGPGPAWTCFHFDARGGAFRPSRHLYDALVRSGAQLKWYHPWCWRRPSTYFRRNHRKLLVIDDAEAFLGGFNIRLENSRALFGDARQRDTHVSVRGDLVPRAAGLFDRLWEDAEAPHPGAIPDDATEVEALLVPNSSRRCQQRLACLLAGLIAAARRDVYLTTPYFCPETIIVDAIRTAAARGVDVRLLVPRLSDPPITGWATRAAYARLLDAGARIFEYRPPRKLHAKTWVIDGEWAVVGSANLDHLSLFVNLERRAGGTRSRPRRGPPCAVPARPPGRRRDPAERVARTGVARAPTGNAGSDIAEVSMSRAPEQGIWTRAPSRPSKRERT